MRDLISIPRAKLLHPFGVADKWVKSVDAAEAKLGPYAAIRLVQGLRAFEEQAAIYAIGRTVKGPNARPGKPMGDTVTNAPPGYSFHNYGLAGDFAILYDKDKNGTFESLSWDLVADMNRDGEADWKEVVNIFIADGWEWGGDWISRKDNPHLELRFGYPEDCHQLLYKYQAGDFIPGTKYLNL